MYRSIFGDKTLNEPRPRLDRFVTPRQRLPELSRNFHWGTRENATFDIWNIKHLREKRYVNYLQTVFGLEQESRAHEDCVQVWPCRPRKKSYLSSADSILDLPNYSEALFPELLDWSYNNILVAGLGNHYHKWSCSTQSYLSEGLTMHHIRTCKIDPTGKLLTLGTDRKVVEIHNVEQSKAIDVTNCMCLEYRPRNWCSVVAMDWSPTGSSFITGCTYGTITSFEYNSRRISTCNASTNSIFITRISPDARLVAVATLDSDQVQLFTWPIFQLLTKLSSNWTVTALTWHPWRSALLAIGTYEKGNTRIALLDAQGSKFCKMQNTLCKKDYTVDVMLFSERTGELVLSLYYIGPGLQHCRLVVMSDPDTVVDQWGNGLAALDRIRTMIFSPDGSQIAAATADDDLVILKFLPEDNQQKKRKIYNRFCAIPTFLDRVTVGFSLR